jgi:hypothetical protein
VQDYWTTTLGSGDALYAIANSYYDGGGALRTYPVSRSVTYDERNNTISYEFEYDDWSTNYTEDLTVTVSNSQDECDITNVTIEGTLTGHCDAGDSAWDNVLQRWAILEPTIPAIAASYEPTVNTSVTLNSSTSYNEFNKQISFSREYSNRSTDCIEEVTVTVNYSQDECEIANVTVEGSIKGLCSTGVDDGWANAQTCWAALKPTLPGLAQSYVADINTNVVLSSSTGYNEEQSTITFSREYSNRDTNCIEEVTVTVNYSQDDCEHGRVTVEGSVKGLCSDTQTGWENAQTCWAALEPTLAGLASAADPDINTDVILSKSTGTNESQATITFSREYGTRDENYTEDLTVTVTTSQDDCGITSVTVEGSIKGLCDDLENGWTNVQTRWTALEPTLLGIAQGYVPDANVLVRTSVGYNEFNATITFSYEYNDRQEDAIVEYTTLVRDGAETCLQTVTVEGNVRGYCTDQDDPESAYNNAVAAYNADVAPNIEAWAQAAYTGSGALDTLPSRQSKGENKKAGTITFSFEYNDRPAKCITDALTESVQWTHQHPADMFAIVPVLGRVAGPVLQDKGTIKELRSTLSIEVTVCATGSCDPTSGGPGSEVTSSIVAPISANLAGSYTQVFKEGDTESWNPSTGRYSRTITWVYQNC